MKWYKLNLNDCSSHHCLSSLIATNITHIKVFPSRSGKKYANTDSIHFFFFEMFQTQVPPRARWNQSKWITDEVSQGRREDEV